MLKPIKNNSDINFHKLPDNSNFEINAIKTVKPNLKFNTNSVFKEFLRVIFGYSFVSILDKYSINYHT